MERATRKWEWGIVLIGILAAALWLQGKQPEYSPPILPDRVDVSQEYLDLALTCLIAGKASPPVNEIDVERLQSIQEALARTFEAYMTGSFESVLQAHRSDLIHASEQRHSEVDGLRQMLEEEFGIARSDAPQEWTAALGAFWKNYYDGPIIHAISPKSVNFEIRHCRLGDDDSGAAIEESASSFEKRRDDFLNRINYRMSFPHRRTPEEILSRDGALSWFHFEVEAWLGRGDSEIAATVLLRYVYDPIDAEWFLHRALTAYPDEVVLDRTSVFLLF